MDLQIKTAKDLTIQNFNMLSCSTVAKKRSESEPLLNSETVVQTPVGGNCCRLISFGQQLGRRKVVFLIVLSTANFLVAITYSLLAPFYPEEAERKGVTPTEYGLVFGIFELVAFLLSPIVGLYLHCWGPKLIYNAGLFITGASSVLFGFLATLNDHTVFIIFSFLIRIFGAVGNAAFATSSFSILVDEFPENVATTFASLETIFGLGLIVGPTLGGALYEVGGFQLPYAVIGILVIALTCCSAFLLPSTDDRGHPDLIAPGIATAFRVPSVLLAAFTIFNASLTMGLLGATLEPHIRPFGLSPVETGCVFMIHGGIYALTAPLWGWLCDRYSHPKLLSLAAIAAIALGFCLIGPAPFVPANTSLWMVCVGLAVYGLGVGITMVTSFIIALQDIIKSGFPDNIHTYGVVSAMWNSSCALGAFVGPSLGGFLLDEVGFRWTTVFVLVLQLIVASAFTVSICMSRKSRRVSTSNIIG